MSDSQVNNIKYLKILLIITGSWRLPLTNNFLLKTIYNLYSFTYQMILMAFYISFLINIPVSLLSNNFKMLNNVILYLVTLSLILAKNFIYQTTDVQNLVLQCENEIFKEKNGCLWGIAQSNAKILNRIYAFILSVTICAVFFTVFYGLTTCLEYQNNYNLTDNKPPMLPLWYPFDQNVYFWTSFVLGLLPILLGSLCSLATQALYLTLTTHVIFQLKSLQLFAEDLDLCYNVNLAHRKREEEENKILNALKWLCCKHNGVIKFVRKLNISIRSVLIMDFSLYSVNISAAIVGIFMVETSFWMNVSFGLQCLLQLSQMFLMAWHSNEICIQSTALSDALYQSQWYQYPTTCQKIIRMMMMRSTKPLELYIGLIFPLTNKTALVTLKAAYSYVTLIFSLANKK